MKKIVFSLLLSVLLIGGILTGCSSQETQTTAPKEVAKKQETVKVKVGVNGSGVQIWDFIKEKAAKEGIEIEILEFADYVRPNLALQDGDIDINAFQTISYFNQFKKDQNLDLVPIATTVIAPMGLYSDKYKSANEIPNGAEIVIPDDASNLGRSLLLLQEAGLIKLVDGFDGNGDLEAIRENPKNLKITPIVAAQTPRVLPDVAASAINNGVAVEAGFIPVKDAFFIEGATSTPYINIIAARSADKDNPTYKRIVEIYQQDDVAEFIKVAYKNSLVPTFVPLSEIGE